MSINFQLKTFSEHFYMPHTVQNDPCEEEINTIPILHIRTPKDKDIK